jgi:PEP-CTERM motif
MKLTTIAIGLMAMTMSLPAATILFGGGNSLGSSATYGPVTATGYLSNGITGTLFGKGSAGTGSEDGLGLTTDPTGDDEIYARLATGAPASDFIQLDITALSGKIIQISMGSTGGDGWAIFGTNTLGSLSGATSLKTGGNDDGSEITIPGAGSYKYLDITATSNNVLLQDLVYTNPQSSVPEPGTFGIVGLGGVLIGLLRRKSQQS